MTNRTDDATGGRDVASSSESPEDAPRVQSEPAEQDPDDSSLAGTDPFGTQLTWDPGPQLDVSVVVPVQNADAEVRQVVEALGRELDSENRSWECIFVFDGVQGAAWEEVQEQRAKLGRRVRSISFKNPFGESVCLSAAVERARGRYPLDLAPVRPGRPGGTAADAFGSG